MPDHSPEPWAVERDEVYVEITWTDPAYVEKYGTTTIVQQYYDQKEHGDEAERDFRRAVACVNALAGIENPEAFVAESSQLRDTNRKLNRRCQQLESAIKKNAYWSMAYQQGREAGLKDKTEESRWQWIAQKHGVTNAKLKREAGVLKAEIATLKQQLEHTELPNA